MCELEEELVSLFKEHGISADTEPIKGLLLELIRRGRATCGSLGGNPDAVKTLCEQWGVVNILDKTGIALALGGLEMYPKKERPQDCDFTTAITGWIEFTSQLHQRVNTIEQQLQAILEKQGEAQSLRRKKRKLSSRNIQIKSEETEESLDQEQGTQISSPPPESTMTFKEFTLHLLHREKKPLHVAYIAEIGMREGKLSTQSRTPAAVLSVILEREKKIVDSPFVKTGPNTYGLREWKEEPEV